MNLVHVIPALRAGGPTRGLKVLMTRLEKMRHTVLALEAPVRGGDLVDLLRTGAHVLRAPDPTQITDAVRAADVVLVHYYNHPLLLHLLAGPLPPARWVAWFTVLGRARPQVFHPDRLHPGVQCVFTAAPPGSEPVSGSVIPSMVEAAFLDLQRAPHTGRVIDYIGSTNIAKLHPDTIRLLAPLRGATLRIRIHGGRLSAAMQEELGQDPNAQRFELGGFANDVPGLLSTSDIFITPMAPESYASSDLSLQEAMHAGLPAVVMGQSGPADMITHGHDGLVARTGSEFTNALQQLCDDSVLCCRLGEAARATARARFDPAQNAARMREVLEARAAQPKSEFGLAAPTDPPVALYLRSQGWTKADAVNALADWQTGERTRLESFAAGLSRVAAQVEGGLLHWRNTFVNDAVLRWFAGVWLQRAGATEQAAVEFAAADTLSRTGATTPRAITRAD